MRHASKASALVLLLAGSGAAAQGAPDPVVSPEIDGRAVTFRIRAAEAGVVTLESPGDMPSIPFGEGLPMDRDDDGVWSVTVDAVPAGAYRYSFDVDGLTVLDPSNRHTSESNRNAWSLYAMAGSDAMDLRDVPHGAVAELHYHSSVLGRARRMHVYTPPGYETGERAYPVFYLLHGAMDSDDSWTTVGRANAILDNMIADGAAEPMIVVMPDGHTGPFVRGGSGLTLDEFAREFATDIRREVEGRYRVAAGRANTAIAGLSMGGAQTLEIAARALTDYGYIGVFSSGVFGVNENDDWEATHRAVLDDAKRRDGLELVWFSTGRDDFVLDTTEATVAMLRGHGFDVEYIESAGGHTWTNWRDYLQTFAARLFE